jgi:hypothetical protein
MVGRLATVLTLKEGVTTMATSPQDAMACYCPPLMIGASWVRVVRRITEPQGKARLWSGRTFHVKHAPSWALVVATSYGSAGRVLTTTSSRPGYRSSGASSHTLTLTLPGTRHSTWAGAAHCTAQPQRARDSPRLRRLYCP